MAKKKKEGKKSVQVMADGSERYTLAPTEEVVESVIDELESMLVERTKQAREYTLMVFWEAGKMMRGAEKEHRVNISGLIGRVAHDNRISGRQMGERNLWMALKIYDTYPTFEKVYNTEHGENITVSKLKKLLTLPAPKKELGIDEVAMSLFKRYGVDDTKKLIKALQKLID